ncbi:hypothetical protein [Nonomuraea basaltis]|uniref:hypothetical protein n=1 Tax=Nonomuraea basaltis TaxID=2495887 RepID=UPI00110C5319|nr:hypothetical protein [Nonomuraea basaltis]TMR98710.1 hypothetical protein EJK15_11270 [Nonomuraea basaltis]
MTATRSFPGWDIIDGAGGGYIAIRTVLVPENSGLSNIRCGATLLELYKHLEQEMRRQERPSPTRKLPGAA